MEGARGRERERHDAKFATQISCQAANFPGGPGGSGISTEKLS